MPEYNSLEINICGKIYKVQTDEKYAYIKKIEDMINTKVNQFKSTDRKFDNYSSLAFTAFVISDKYLKLLEQLESEKSKNQDFISLNEVKRIKDEKANLTIELESSIHENEKILQELIRKNSEFDILKNKILEFDRLLKEKDEEIMIIEEINRELELKNKKISNEMFLLREEIEIRD